MVRQLPDAGGWGWASWAFQPGPGDHGIGGRREVSKERRPERACESGGERGRSSRNRLDRRSGVPTALPADRGRLDSREAAGIDQFEVGETDGHVEGDAVVAHPVLDADADGADLAAPSAAPAAGVAVARTRLHAEGPAGLGERGFQGPNERPDQQASIHKTNDRVGGQLAGPVVGDLAAPFSLDQFYGSGGQVGRPREDVGWIAVAPESQHRLMLQQQELVADRTRHAGLDQSVLEVPSIAVSRPAEPPGGDRRGRRDGLHWGVLSPTIHAVTIAGACGGAANRRRRPVALDRGTIRVRAWRSLSGPSRTGSIEQHERSRAMSRKKRIGILTAGGDSPGLNAAIRGVGKSAVGHYGMQLVGFRDGFRGLVEDRYIPLEPKRLSGILTIGGTILGTSRDKPHQMLVDGVIADMTGEVARNYEKHRLDALVCLGGGGTAKNALRLANAGLNVITLPKTIDNDVVKTDASFGFATALDVATEAIDRLHSTAHSHHRIIVVEIMGHGAGWLALGAGIAGGADVILIPEIPYSVEVAAEAIRRRVRNGSNFSIVAIAEGARNVDDAQAYTDALHRKKVAPAGLERDQAIAALVALEAAHVGNTLRVASTLEELTGLESRVTILGYVQRGGTPSATDRLLATRLGSAGADLIADGVFGVMVASRGDRTAPVPLEEVAGKRRLVPIDHSWVQTARHVGVCLGDE
jgi:6-phosphofructokinase 1